ncbi:hydantoinase/oxoprolinase family protein [Bradyrhizobium sp. NP1]|uniref:hydantoinase/oxoprolinase family protein n=1 Tax=Bradyrhizobium sp. NP1 TaxID=3049772 RepID=UPI0025A68DA0|nr:hydantoinase/oxoprolinase family protein [Bradyrhizobium sp. NP1]WJR75848.1 hydantoinase/oxoprolinase family protein [Bradyrhizobium sp. NP1]
MAYIGTDIGGTFTDLVLLSDDGQAEIFKALTTPDDRTRGVIDALELAAKAKGISSQALIEQLRYFSHGTTAATNAFIERKGARTGLLTTRGFEDTLRIQRAMAGWIGLPIHEISHFSKRRVPTQIVPPELIRGVIERVDYKGKVIVRLDEEDARAAIRALLKEGVEAIAISLLWSFRNPAHEQRLIELIKEEAPGLFVTASSLLVPIIGEYERTSTTAINAYLGPVIHRYVNGLENAIRGLGFEGPISIMESGGGVLPASEAAFQAANLLTSGPAGGVLASQKLGELLGYQNILTADMGGTSFDVGLIVNGQPLLETVREEGRFHVALPSIKVTAIGAGGGSIARVQDGHLTVGPESAGSTPGPACYGRGGKEPTITDADVVLGIIDPKYFLGGAMALDVEAAKNAVKKYVAEPLGVDVAQAAAGIREVANNQMADLLRRVTLRAGYDPRDFVLMAYGGAGATHAHQYAEVAGISRVVVPVTGPAHSAYGTVTGDRHRSFSLAFGQHAPARFKKASEHIDLSALNSGLQSLEDRARLALGSSAHIRRFIGMRFRQQVHEIAVELAAGAVTLAQIDKLVDQFEAQYEKIYGENTALRISGVEFNVLRVEATSPVTRPEPRKMGTKDRSNRPIDRREVFFYGHGFVTTDIYRIEDVGPGVKLQGPCIIERPDTTIVTGPNQSAEMEAYGNIVIQIA